MPNDSTTGNKACCWICLEEGNDDHGQPLTRNCACRGDSGWAHVACLARFAKVQTNGMSADDYSEIIECWKGTAWSVCHNCKQEYHGVVKTSLSKEWVNSVAGLDDASPHRIASLLNFSDTSLQNDAFDVAIQTCENLRGILHSNVQDIDSTFWNHAEVNSLGMLTHAYTLLGNKEKGLEYAEKLKSFNSETGFSNPNTVKDVFNVVTERLAPDENQGGSDLVEMATNMYNSAVETNGKDSPAAIKMAGSVASAMLIDLKFEESYHWHKDAHDRAKRVLGKDNPEYINIKRKYLCLCPNYGIRKGTLMLDNSKLNGKEVTILRATKDGKKYIVEIGSGTGSTEKVKVTPSQLIFASETPVTIDREGFTFYLDSFDKKANSYKIIAMCGINDHDEYIYMDVPRKDVAVIFPSHMSR